MIYILYYCIKESTERPKREEERKKKELPSIWAQPAKVSNRLGVPRIVHILTDLYN